MPEVPLSNREIQLVHERIARTIHQLQDAKRQFSLNHLLTCRSDLSLAAGRCLDLARQIDNYIERTPE